MIFVSMMICVCKHQKSSFFDQENLKQTEWFSKSIYDFNLQLNNNQIKMASFQALCYMYTYDVGPTNI